LPDIGLNRQHLAALDLAEKVCRAALEPAHLALLTAPDDEPADPNDESVLTEERLKALEKDIAACRLVVSAAQGQTSKSRQATLDLAAAEDELIEALRTPISRAKQKHAGRNPALLEKYHVGHGLEGARSSLVQFGTDVLEALKTDRLQGINAKEKSRLTAAVQTLKTLQAEQEAAGAAERAALVAQVASIELRRRSIQFAADAIWPWTNPLNVEIRLKFGLRKDQMKR